ncbi:transcriptional regulator [Francisella sp. LA112445]|uniref:helix-turn-helix transcriptional regulator n=1 Tax=Francisella sp. LA112445 TaxID=1395624 RepID=UPI001788D4D3|nr:transcriptional regulator [Francisella sp. LA112445]QIW10152.1 transcriptional regulator [Francisella sp. LA112445]
MKSKSDYNKTLDRLLIILNYLNNNPNGYTSSELASELNVSIRTIQRDLSERLSAFPIYKEARKWRFVKGYDLNNNMSTKDALILSIIDKFAENIGGDFNKTTKRILSNVTNTNISSIYTKLNIEDISDIAFQVSEIEHAIDKKQILKCTYRVDNASYEVELKPLKIVNYDGYWYLLSLSENIIKKYYLKNISNVQKTNINFDISTNIDQQLDKSLSIWFGNSNKYFKVRLLIRSDIIKYFERLPISKSQKIEKIHQNGDVELSLSISHEMEILPIIKKWLPKIDILEPVFLRDKLISDMKEYLKSQKM